MVGKKGDFNKALVRVQFQKLRYRYANLLFEVEFDFVSLGFAYVVFMQRRRFNRVDNTHFVVIGNNVSNKVVTVICERMY